MKQKLRSVFVSCLIITFAFFWLSQGPHFEGLNQFTALSFFTGILCGIFWGIYLSMTLVVEMGNK